MDANELSVSTISSCTIALQESLNDNAYRVYSSVPELLSALSYIVLVNEFLCAQVPYSMKGLVVGIYYGSLVLFPALNKGMLMLNSPSWSFGIMFICGFWYLLINLFFLLVIVTVSPIVSLCYKKRKRDDVFPNE